MERSAIADRRLLNQGLAHAGRRRPADVVAWCGAVQAQEYEPARWGVGLRMRDGATAAQVEAAFEKGEILRTHVLRPTWHFVTPADIRWMLELTAPRIQRLMATYNRRLELDAATLTRGTAILERALGDGQHRTRAELAERLEDAGLAMKGQRLAHLAAHAEFEGVICSGPRRGKKFTYALLAERAPGARRLERDEALAELTRRYFQSHGPATIRDFVWWSGLLTADAKRGLELSRARHQEVDGKIYWTVGSTRLRPTRVARAHLLPIYDEYLVAYQDRTAVPHASLPAGSPGRPFTTFQHALIIDGQVAGTWRAARTPRALTVHTTVLRPWTKSERRALTDAAERFASFHAMPLDLVVR